ncbi:YwdI family protein [Salimicrobium humidisoli]|uniref:YwdI family protein n=1 Tax=Salimicrobium humidisoli TaxID=2029857 RepID=A0ABX4HT29_9BACI|nr:YwdI family protein [Salimicrobium humidisoli]PBB06374.1 hypothetical protein CKW00_03320 [Salimicrobium humidisoli]
MSISMQQLLQRMNKEIEEAMLRHEDPVRVREHARAVRLLCDLVLEEERQESAGAPATGEKNDMQPTAEEMRKMMGQDPPERKSTNDKLDHDGANGSSIFDF